MNYKFKTLVAHRTIVISLQITQHFVSTAKQTSSASYNTYSASHL